MEFRFTFMIEGLGAPRIAADNAEALLDAFERTAPGVGAAVGAKLEEMILEASFHVEGDAFDDAAKHAGDIFLAAAIASMLPPSDLVGLEVETTFPNKEPVVAFERSKGRPSDERTWSLPEQLVHP